MPAHWAEAYVGRPYVFGESDCAQLAADVRREVFGDSRPAEVAQIERAASALGRARQIDSYKDDFGEQVAIPAEGDAVLMRCRGRVSHVGVYCEIAGEPYVLHAMKNAGMAVLHRLRDLPRVNLYVAGYWRWK